MKDLLLIVFGWFGLIPKDKYQHFALGSLLAMLFFVGTFWLPFWFSFVVSVFTTMGIEVAKEYYIDEEPDWWDIAATFLGGLMVWCPLLVAF